jgi:hypothetical protein
LLNLIRQRILRCSEGELDFANNYIELRQNSLKALKDIWAPKGAKKIIEQKFNGNFQSLINNFFELILQRDQYRIDYVREIILVATERKIILSDDAVVTIITNANEYPALYTLIRLQAYLNYLTEMQSAVPREDRFSDGLIMIEYAYCDLIISTDEKLVTKHGQSINPAISLITTSKLFDNFNIVSDCAVN